MQAWLGWFGLAAMGAIAAIVLFGGRWRWQQRTQALQTRLAAARRPLPPLRVEPSAWESLPAPVQRYFCTALSVGQPLIAGAHLEHRGQFNLSDRAEAWRPFTSEQQVALPRPGFVWSARIAIAPGLSVWVHDAYLGGEGLLHAALLGWLPLVKLQDSSDLAQGELLRFLAEAVWYPTALLPSQGIFWEAAGDRAARATLTDGDCCATLLFSFNGLGLVESVRAEARSRLVAGESVPTPWQGRFWNYTERDGMQIPLAGEVAWLLPEGPRPYWRATIERITYAPAVPN